MNDIDELIATLETEADAFANYGGAYDPDDYRLRAATALQEMQANLSAPLPDEVEEMVQRLNEESIDEDSAAFQAIDLIERLQRSRIKGR